MFELKLLSRDAVPAALEKAHRYRLLNEPLEAESICRDVLAVDPDNQQALVTLVLAVADQFPQHLAGAQEQARGVLAKLRDDYTRAYYTGIVVYRRAKAALGQRGSGEMVHELLHEAMEWFERAAAIRPPANDDALLRWNACARLLMAHPELAPRGEETFRPFLE